MIGQRTISYRADIDGLRSIAVLLVMIFHFQILSIGKGGFLGVDIFFVISGFLITSILLKELQDNTFSFRGFFKRRILRLAPPLFCTLIGVMIAGWLLYFPAEFKELAQQVVATQLYFANIYFWQNVNYFGLYAESVPLLHTWSLAIEEQFYLLFPIVVFVIYRWAKMHFWKILCIGTVISFALNLALTPSKPELTFYLMPTRGWEFLIGALAAPLSHQLAKLPRQHHETLAIIGIALIAGAVAFYSEGIAFPGSYALLPTLATALIIVSGHSGKTLICRALSSPLLVYIGRLSYPLYLCHWPIHVFAAEILEDDYTMAWRLAMFALTFIFAAAIFHLVEIPIRKGTGLRAWRSPYTAYAWGVAASMAFSMVIIYTHGMPNRFPERVITMANYSQDKPPPMQQCQHKDKLQYNDDDFCTIGSEGVSAKWLVIGDSHAWAAKEAFSKWLQMKNEAGLFLFRHACPPLRGLHMVRDQGKCFNFNDKVYDYMGRATNIENVVLVSAWIYGSGRSITDNPSKLLTLEESRRIFDRQFAFSLAQINNDLGKNVYLWEPVPGARGNVPQSLARASNVASESERLSFSLQEHRTRHDYFYKNLEQNKSKVTLLFSPAQALCETGLCKVQVNNKPVYFDSSHLTFSLSSYWADVLLRQEAEARQLPP